MSQPDDSTPLSPDAPLEALPVPAAPIAALAPPDAPMPMPMPGGMPMPGAMPYRTPETSQELMWPPPVRAVNRPRPVIGPALSVFAVALWAFVVAGHFATSWSMGAPLSNGAAILFVFFTTSIAWIANLRRSQIAMPTLRPIHLVGRAIGVAILAFGLFASCLAVSVIAGAASSTKHDFLIPAFLVGLSLAAAIVGPKWTSPTPLERTHRMRSALVMTWIAGVILTLATGIDLAANG